MLKLEKILHQQFPTAKYDPSDPDLGVGSFPEWDSLGTFNILLLVEQEYGVRFNTEEMAELKTIKNIRKKLLEIGVEA